MNFRPESGYDAAVKVFRAIAVPISDKNLSPPASQGSLTRPVSQWSGQQVPKYRAYKDDVQMIPRVCYYVSYLYHNTDTLSERLLEPTTLTSIYHRMSVPSLASTDQLTARRHPPSICCRTGSLTA